MACRNQDILTKCTQATSSLLAKPPSDLVDKLALEIKQAPPSSEYLNQLSEISSIVRSKQADWDSAEANCIKTNPLEFPKDSTGWLATAGTAGLIYLVYKGVRWFDRKVNS